MEFIKLEGIKIYYQTGYYDKQIIIKKGTYNKLKKLSEESLIKLAKVFDEDFYTNDGYDLEIYDKQFSYRYDDGSGNIEIFEVSFR